MLDNIDPKLWGSSYWDMIHYTAIAYPEYPTNEDKENIKIFISSLSNILPCEKCRNHFKNNLLLIPLSNDVISSKKSLIQWTVDIHNEVNSRTNKHFLSLDDVMEKYTKNTNTVFDKQKITTILLLLLIILIIIHIKNY
jgi:mitochondrial FAD-linked sulfhydryl oxidase